MKCAADLFCPSSQIVLLKTNNPLADGCFAFCLSEDSRFAILPYSSRFTNRQTWLCLGTRKLLGSWRQLAHKYVPLNDTG